MLPRALAALLAALVLAPAAQAAPEPPFGHEGRWITDSDGRVLVTHGVNLVYKVPPYEPSVSGFSDDDAEFLAREGFNSVRLGVIYKAVEPEPGRYDDAYLAKIAETAQLLGRHGITPLIDFHQDLYNERFEGEGWPDWAVIDDGLPAAPKNGFPTNYILMPALNRAFDHFWANDQELQDHYAAAWRHVAERFAPDQWVLGYDLLNEPWPGTGWQECANPAGCARFDGVMAGFVKRTLEAIRAADGSHIVWYEPNVIFNDGADTQLPKFDDKRLGMSWHNYCLAAGGFVGSSGANACDTEEVLPFQNAEKRSKATGDTNLMTEFGATEDVDLIHRIVARADEFMTSWQWWHYCGCNDPTTAGPGETQAIVKDPAKPPTGDNLKPAKLAVLVRPYPQLVAGTPKAWKFDDKTKVFTFSWSGAKPGGGSYPSEIRATEVFIPARHYPKGYAVQAKNAAVVSSRGARLLRLRICPGAESAEVHVAPDGESGVGCAAGTAGAKGAALRLTVKPRRVKAGQLVRFRFRVTTSIDRRRVGVSGARIRFAGRNAKTNGSGRATIRVRIRRPGHRRAIAFRRTFRRGSVGITIAR